MLDQQALILGLIDRGCANNEVLAALSDSDGQFASRESDLWDYKLQVPDDKLALAELVRDIVAFHNSYGGYLIVGISDDCRVHGCEPLDERQIRQYVRNYTGADVPLIIQSVRRGDATLAVILVPKRTGTSVPLPISKVGPDVSPRKPLFKPGDVFFRSLDSSQLIRGAEDLRFLLGGRAHSAAKQVLLRSRVLSHNLPERSVVFSRFFGREAEKRELWMWLADPLSRYRVVAGPGGFGKTSAAYKFCEEVCAESPLGIEQVVWLSAKQQQFDASKNASERLPYLRASRQYGEHYSDYLTLLDALSYHLAITDEEWDGGDVNAKVQLISDGLAEIPTLIVVDDLDSLTPDEQRRAVELAMTLGRSGSRFLFTTRKNYLAPASSTTELRGLSGEEYLSYLTHLQERYGRTLSASEAKSMVEETEGSPLFTESIFRLLRLGSKFGEAMARWKGTDGESVRAASFSRELEQLPWAAKKVLYAISLFESVSASEIRQLTELEIPDVEAAILELEGLFLLNSKQIGDQPRFGVAPNLRRLLGETKEKIPNQIDIYRRAALARTELRTGSSRGTSRDVGNAIQQAIAQMRNSDFSGAKSTIESALIQNGNSPDLQMFYARCLTNILPINVSQIRQAFQRSYDLGKRESDLFSKWLDFELTEGSANAAVDVAEKGAKAVGNRDWRWSERRATAYIKRGFEREGRREFLDAMSDLRTASKSLKSALRYAPFSARSSLVATGQRLHDGIWRIANLSSSITLADRVYYAQQAVDSGDRREICLMRVLESLEAVALDPSFVSKRQSQIEDWFVGIERALRGRTSDRASARLLVLRKRYADMLQRLTPPR